MHSVQILILVSVAIFVSGCRLHPDVETARSGVSAQAYAATGRLALSEACAFSRALNGTIAVREASAAAEIAVERIVAMTGLPRNFVLLEADIENAAATIVGQDRVILYDPRIIGRSDWTTLGVIAHEVGHHLSGHTLRTAGRLQDEIEADEFAGFLLGRMEATGSQAEEMMALLSERADDRTHPQRAKRVAAVRDGWGRASNQIDRRSPLIGPGPLPAGVEEEYVYMYNKSGCAIQVFRGTVVRTLWGGTSRLGPAVEIELDLDGPGRRTFFVQRSDLTKIDENHLPIIATEGRRVEIEEATCGSGGFASVSRIKVVKPQ